MPGPRSPREIVLAPDVHAMLVHLSRSPSVPAGVARRARIVLLAAAGVPLRHIGPRVGADRNVVRDWLDRFRAHGPDGLQDRPRPGRRRVFSP
jgi:Helix-turn-helix domain